MATDTFAGLNATAWTAIYTLLTAGLLAVAVIAAVYAKRQWQSARQQTEESRQAQLEANRPYVIVTVDPSPASRHLFDLVVKNVGRRPAFDVSITLDPPPVRASETEGHELSRAKMLTEPIALVAPDQELRAFYDSHIERDGRADLPASHHVAVRYRDSSDRSYAETAVIDIDVMRGTMFADVKTVHDVGKALVDIQQTLKNAGILSRQGQLDVDAPVEPRATRQRRLSEERATAKERHNELIRRLGKAADAE